MKILALENSSSEGSVALIDGDREIFSEKFPNDRRNSAFFFSAVEKVTSALTGPDVIVVGIGPGSYAGIRIAIAAAAGLKAAMCTRLLGLPSICALPNVPNEYDVVGDARQQSFFHARVSEHSLAAEIQLHSATALKKILTEHAGEVIFAIEKVNDFPSVEIRIPSASLLARIAQKNPERLLNEPLEPMYLRAPHITQPKIQAKPVSRGAR